MAARTFVAQPSSGATAITATGNSAAFNNTSGLNSIDVIIEITAAPTGTSPTLAVQLQSSLDGTNFNNVGSATSNLTAAGRTVLTNNNVDEPFLRLAYTVGGTTPSFSGVEINVYAF